MKKTKTAKKKESRLNARNWGVFIALMVLVVLIYGITVVRMKAGY